MRAASLPFLLPIWMLADVALRLGRELLFERLDMGERGHAAWTGSRLSSTRDIM